MVSIADLKLRTMHIQSASISIACGGQFICKNGKLELEMTDIYLLGPDDLLLLLVVLQV